MRILTGRFVALNRVAWMLGLLVALSACDGGSTAPAKDTATAQDVDDDGIVTDAGDTAAADTVETADGQDSDTGALDGEDSGAGTDAADTADSADASACPGAPGCACTEDSECTQIALCVPAADGTSSCATPCTAATPCGGTGQSCAAVEVAGSSVDVCVDADASLCAPCATDADCAVPGGDASCLRQGGAGAFCASACTSDADCADGYVCGQGQDADGKTLDGCVPKDAAVCTCSGWAKAAGTTTTCWASGLPGCTASIGCEAAGLQACAAAAAQAEACNGKDDDCDGQTDELPSEGVLCDDGNPCTDDACGGGVCLATPTTATCDDGDKCTEGEACAGGACVGGLPAMCDDGNPCTDDSCDTATGCVNLPNKATCDDADACTENDACALSLCGGATVTCDDGDPCTDDSCDPATGCKHSGNTAPCNDGDACTEKDACLAGKCAGASKNCDDSNPCTTDSCDDKVGCRNIANIAACDDGDACTTGDVCKDSKCIGGAAKCDDGNPCTDDACDKTTGTCTQTANTVFCDDGDPCTEKDACAAKKCAGKPMACEGTSCQVGTCQAGKCALLPKDCDDGNPCTTDSCDAKAGCATFPVVNCGLGKPLALPYTEWFACNSQSAFLWQFDNAQQSPGWAIDATPALPGAATSTCALNFNDGKNFDCKTGSTKVLGTATSPPIDLTKAKAPKLTYKMAGNYESGIWDNLAVLISTDAGQSWKTIAADVPPALDSTTPYRTDSYDLTAHAGSVVLLRFEFKTTDCISNSGTGPFIDVLSIAEASGCTVDAQCFDGNACTADTCDKATGTCKNTAQQGQVCDDGNFCTANDACTADATCKGTPAVCDDNNPCTDDSCEPTTGKCSVKANKGGCDDGAKCTAGDACVDGVCNAGKPLSCDDGNPCTSDACDVQTGLCSFQPIVGCSQPCKNALVCDDGNPCTADTCDTATGKCSHAPLAAGSLCADLQTCGATGACSPISPKGWAASIHTSAGAYHNCALLTDGTVACWGDNISGQIGNGTTTDQKTPAVVKGLKDVVAVGVGSYTTCAVTKDGKLWCWGDNYYHQLVDGTTTDAKEPKQIPGIDSVKAVAVGYGHVCALKIDGTLWCWGRGLDGELGHGDSLTYDKPKRVEGLTGVRAVRAGYYNTAVLREDGSVWTWGYNLSYETGVSSTADVTVPTLRKELGIAVDLAVGYNDICALSGAGVVRCVGDDGNGQLGNGDVTIGDNKDGAIFGIDGVAALSVGYYNTSVIRNDGRNWTAGDGYYGQLGVGTTTDSHVPVLRANLDNLIDVAAGRYHVCVLRADGQVWCSGDNANGQIGNDSTVDATVAVRAFGGPCKANSECADTDVCVVETCDAGVCKGTDAAEKTKCDDGDDCTVGDACDGKGACASQPKDCADADACTLLPACEPGGKCVQTAKVDCDDGNDCTADACDPKTGACNHTAIPGCKLPCKQDGDCNDGIACTADSCVAGFCEAKVGNDGTVCAETSACAQGACTPMKLAGWAKNIVSGNNAYHTCAVLADGSASCWGYNSNGQLGDGTTTNSGVPVAVKDLKGIKDMSAGYHHTCAITEDGKAWCWGDNAYGQLGNGDKVDQKTPVQVAGLGSAVMIRAGYYHTCALLTDKSVWCWGYNSDGQLGDGTTTTSTAPVKVIGGAKDIGVGYYHAAALLEDGTVWAWGQNTYYQSNADSTADQKTPTQRAGLKYGVQVTCGSYTTCVRQNTGTVVCVGRNNDGEQGSGVASSTAKADVTKVLGVSNAVMVDGGYYHVVALGQDGKVRGWGANSAKQLGVADTTDQPKPLVVPFISDVVDVAAGRYHTCFLRKDGTVWCVGDGLYGQSGNGSTGTAGDVAEVAPVKNGACKADTECQSGNACVTATCDTQTNNCVLKGTASGTTCNDGDLCTVDDKCDGNGTCASKPKDCDDGDACTLAPACEAGICSQTGKVDCDDFDPCTADACDSKNGQCSHTAIKDCKVPCKADADCADSNACTADTCEGGFCAFKPGNDGNVCGIASTCAAGTCTPLSKGWATRLAAHPYSYHVCAIHPDKTASCWGRNLDGQLGDGTKTNKSSSVKVKGVSGITGMGLGYSHSCAVIDGGKVACWGQNTYGQIGNGSSGTTDVTDAFTIPDFAGVKQVAGGYGHTCAVKTDGTVACWGRNGDGQLGNGTINSSSTAYVKKPEPVPGLSGVAALDLGFNWSCALTNSGQVWCWGDNGYYQYKDDATTDSGKPVQVTDVSKISVLGVGAYTGCYTNKAGTPFCKGYNNYGQCGTGDKISPVKAIFTPQSLGTVSQIQAGYYHSVAVRSDGSAWAWGYNTYGGLGDGTKTENLTPKPMTGGTGVVQAVTYYHGTCVLKGDGSVACTGYNTYGTVGNGTTGSSNHATTLQAVK
ncbi:MAG: hypothetical protein RIT45_479 [Pseudomonadota bacterium]